MKRQTLLKIHLYLSALFTPFIFLMAFTGTSYLLGYKGDVKKEVVKSVELENEKITLEQAQNLLKDIDPDYTFEYLREAGTGAFTRPTTRTYYQFEKNENGITISKMTPNFLRAVIEVHKGHGPGLLKNLEKILGISLMLVLISGIWLAVSVKRDKKITLILIGLGTLVLSGLILAL